MSGEAVTLMGMGDVARRLDQIINADDVTIVDGAMMRRLEKLLGDLKFIDTHWNTVLSNKVEK